MGQFSNCLKKGWVDDYEVIQKDCSACISYIESISQSHVGRLFGNFVSEDIHLIRNESPL